MKNKIYQFSGHSPQFFSENRKVYFLGIDKIIGGAADIVKGTYEKVVLETGGNLVNKIIDGTNDLVRGTLGLAGRGLSKGGELAAKGLEKGGSAIGSASGHLHLPSERVVDRLLNYPVNTLDHAQQGVSEGLHHFTKAGTDLVWDYPKSNFESIQRGAEGVKDAAIREKNAFTATLANQRKKLSRFFSTEKIFNIPAKLWQAIEVATIPFPILTRSIVSPTRFAIGGVVPQIAGVSLDIALINPVKMITNTTRSAVQGVKGLWKTVTSPLTSLTKGGTSEPSPSPVQASPAANDNEPDNVDRSMEKRRRQKQQQMEQREQMRRAQQQAAADESDEAKAA